MSETLSVTEAFIKYRLDYILMKNQSPKTEESYAVACKLFVRRFGDIPVASISFEMAREWREWLGSWQSQDTVRNNIICLRMVLKFLRARGYAVLNYEEIPVQQREKKQVKYLTEEEVEAFIQEVGKPCRGYAEINRIRNIVIVRLLYATGIRNSELCRLNRDTIKNRTFTVVGKSKEEHISFIDEYTEQLINLYLSKRTDNHNALFISHHTGNRINSAQLRTIFQFTCERSERFHNVHPHTIRHSFATKLLQHKVDLRYIGELMGHQDLNTTKLYTHYTNPHLKDIYDNATAY